MEERGGPVDAAPDGRATKLEAQSLARELERKAEFQRHGLEPIEGPVSLTFAELLDWYAQNFAGQLRSQGDRRAAEKHLRPSLGALMLSEVTAARIDEALSAAADALAPKSLNNLRGFAQTVFSKAIQRGLWKGANPADAVPRRKVPKRAPSYLKAEEVGLVLAQVPAEWRCLFATAVYTGMRRGELVALQKGDVDLEQGEIVVTRSWEAGTTNCGPISSRRCERAPRGWCSPARMARCTPRTWTLPRCSAPR